MKLKTIIVPKYLYKEDFKEYTFFNVEICVESNSTVTVDNFNQETDDYYITSHEIMRMSNESKAHKRI